MAGTFLASPHCLQAKGKLRLEFPNLTGRCDPHFKWCNHSTMRWVHRREGKKGNLQMGGQPRERRAPI